MGDLNAAFRILSAPQFIDEQDFGLSNKRKNKADLELFLASPALKTLKVKGIELYMLPLSFGLRIFEVRNDLIVYYTQLEKAQMPQFPKAMMQSAVWRAPTGASPQVAAKVFDYLVQTFGALASDMMQTLKGRQFWIARLNAALLSKGKQWAYVSRGSSWAPLDSLSVLEMFTDPSSFGHAWGTDEHYKSFRFLITKKPLV